MTGEEWLRGIFEPGLRTSKPPYEHLRTELGALAESGVLSNEEASRARARLDGDEHDRHMTIRRRTERAVADARHVGGPRDRLEGMLTPERQLGEIEGITIVVVLIELWSRRLVLRLEARQNDITEVLDAAFNAEWKAWESRWVDHRAAAEAEDVPPPEQPSVSRLSGLPLSVADDVGTRYHAIGTATGGPYPWRSEWRLEPGVPSSARSLRIALENGASGGECLEFALPSRT